MCEFSPNCHETSSPLSQLSRSGIDPPKSSQLGLWHCKFRKATIQTEHDLGKYEDWEFVQTFWLEKMDANLCAKFRLIG